MRTLAAARRTPARRAQRAATALHSAPAMITSAARPEPTAGEDPGQHAEQLLALGEARRGRPAPSAAPPPRRRPRTRRRGTATTADPVADPGPGQQVDRAEGQERHVEDAAEQVEGPEAPGLPAEGGAGPQRRRAEARTSAARPTTPSSWRRRPTSQRSKVEQAKASETRVAPAAKALAVTAGHGSDGPPRLVTATNADS